jgi:hypothetical protein
MLSIFQLARLEDFHGSFRLDQNASSSLASLVARLAAAYNKEYTPIYGPFPSSM